MAERRGGVGMLALGCGAALVVVSLAGVGALTLWALRPVPTLAERGYSEVVLQFDLDDAVARHSDQPADEVRGATMAQALETIRHRVEEHELRDAVVVQDGEDRIVVQLPGVTDPGLIADALSQVALLEFRFVDEQWMPDELSRRVDAAREDAGLGPDASDEQIAAAAAALIPDGHELLWEREPDPATGQPARVRPYLVERGAALTGAQVAETDVSVDQFGQPSVGLEFDAAGKQTFCTMTRQRTGQKLAIVLDGDVLSVPVIQEPICGGQARITMGIGNPDERTREAEELAINLRAGALPAPVSVESTRVIGPAE